VEVDGTDGERALAKTLKIRRRHDDLLGDVPQNEGEANHNLASGYHLPSDSAKPS
jgi:hypothetical protein